MGCVEQGVFFNLSKRKEWDVARISPHPEKKSIRSLNKPLFGDSDGRVKRTEEPANAANSFDVFLALNRRAIG